MSKIFIRFWITVFLFVHFAYAAENFHAKRSAIPSDIKKLMVGHTWNKSCPIGFDKLSYLQVSYWGFDNKTHIGEIIVYTPLANETIDIFRQLYAIKFPIEQMQIPEHLPKSSANVQPGAETSNMNNSSGFYCRADGQTSTKLSAHSYGIAIDINPVYNPAKAGNAVEPENGRKYLDRQLNQPGMINEGSPAFLIFARHGWYWGGYYSQVDYMHFMKIITKQYIVNHLEYIPKGKQPESMYKF